MYYIFFTGLVSRRVSQKCLILGVSALLVLTITTRNHARSHYYRDPTSKFFDPSRAYRQDYSTVRRYQADAFVNISATKSSLRSLQRPPFLCVGMLTITRPSGDVYFRTAVGSLLEGLTRYERDAIHFAAFIGHINASAHPAYTEPWLQNVADQVVTYNNSRFLTEEQYRHVQELEDIRERTGIPDREKHLFDYIQVLKECDEIGAKYIAVVEDDILALDGWFQRMRKGLEEVERRTKIKGQNGFFYLRLFYSEQLLGWNTEEWLSCLRWTPSILLFIIIAHAAMFLSFRRTSLVQNHGKLLLSASLTTVCVMIMFFFMAGRVSMLPLPEGVHEMPKYGCCAQAIVFPKNKVTMLVRWYEEQKTGFVDTLAEKLGDEKPAETGTRWAMTPSVVQHLGGRSSKGDAQWDGDVKYVDGRTASETLWNFAFELNDSKLLKEEHISEAGVWEEADRTNSEQPS